MRHDVQDSHDASARASTTYTGDWHPILFAVEVEVGVWDMVAQYDERYAVIRMLEFRGERGYRVVTWAERSEDRELVGYFRTPRTAAEAGHKRFLKSHGPRGGNVGAYPTLRSHGQGGGMNEL